MLMMMMSGEGQFAMWLAIGAGFLGVFFGPIGQAFGRRIGGPKKGDAPTGLTTGEMTAERMAALEERINEMEAERAGLEERLEFAERMLSSGQAGPRVVGPGGSA